MTHVGDIDIKWHTIQCQAEQSGELVEIEVFNGEYWELFNLDARHTVGDLLEMERTLEAYREGLAYGERDNSSTDVW